MKESCYTLLLIELWRAKEMINKILRTFHIVIIATFLLSVVGCGYKADPYYQKKEVEK